MPKIDSQPGFAPGFFCCPRYAIDPGMSDHLVYGSAPSGLIDVSREASQVSPLVPGSVRLEDIASASAASIILVAPPGTIERRYALALALRALRTDGFLIALAPKDKGGARLRKEFEVFGCVVAEDARKHWRICRVTRPVDLSLLEASIAAGSLQQPGETELWTQPGIFSWDRTDEGTALLLSVLQPLAGRGADFGCGLGILCQAALESGQVEWIDAIDLDARAIDAARRNVPDERLHFHWHDLREPLPLADLDFVLMNPPFHSGGSEDIDLGRIFLRRAHAALRARGTLWMVANRHLPYEAELRALFPDAEPVTQNGRFKVYRARK